MYESKTSFTPEEKRYIEKAINNEATSLSEIHFTGKRVPPNVEKFTRELQVAQSDYRDSQL